MKPRLKRFILDILKKNRLLTLATIRPDGWPQATTVGYGSEGLVLYILCDAGSQKARNLKGCSKVSLTIDHDTDDMLAIKALSMAAIAEPVTDEAEFPQIYRRIMQKYPSYKDVPMPDPAGIRCYRLLPKVISVLDYSKGFGHTELVRVTREDLKATAKATRGRRTPPSRAARAARGESDARRPHRRSASRSARPRQSHRQ